MGDAIRTEDDRPVRHLVLCRPGKYNTITPALRNELDAADADVRMIGRFGNTFAKLHSISKPTLAAVQGWCIAGADHMSAFRADGFNGEATDDPIRFRGCQGS